MPIQTKELPRIFRYGSLTLEDPDPTSTPEQVRDYMAMAYPELEQATVIGPTETDEGIVYEFQKSYGTKASVSTGETISVIELSKEGPERGLSSSQEDTGDLMQHVAESVYNNQNGERMTPASSALGLV